jgi:endonuclease YncB( thermonuclease family)
MRGYVIFLIVLFSFSCNRKDKKRIDQDEVQLINELKEISFFEAKVIHVIDGDTYTVLYNKTKLKIRSAHIDCPENNTPYHKEAKIFAKQRIHRKKVKIVPIGAVDRYKRIVAEVYYDEINLNKELIRNGLAFHFKKYSQNSIYDSLEIEARKQRLNVWSNSKNDL